MNADRYEQGGTEYISVEYQGWIYRFKRLRDDEPFTYDMRQRPDGTRSTRSVRVPQPVVEHMQQYDCAQLHPEKKKFTR